MRTKAQSRVNPTRGSGPDANNSTPSGRTDRSATSRPSQTALWEGLQGGNGDHRIRRASLPGGTLVQGKAPKTIQVPATA